LSFSWRGFANTNTSADAVYISEDYGADWCRIKDFDDPQKTYKAETLDLVASAKTCGLTLNDHFQIRFQFFGFNGIQDATPDGYGIDNINLFALKPVAYMRWLENDTAFDKIHRCYNLSGCENGKAGSPACKW
jgi:hypothetical protein